MKKLLLLPLLFLGSQAFAQDPTFTIEIKDHKFIPATLEVLANQKFTLIVKNNDGTAEEFESSDLKKEKMVKGGKEIKMVISPLKSGEYKFFGEFHAKTAQGKIIAK